MAVTLTLGGVTFEEFEVPESINFGGDQALAVHKLPGGARVIDAMGRDDKDVGWSGRFRGSAAVSRARRLDYLRIQGQPLLLTWGVFRYRVVLRTFEAQYQQAFEIPYSLACVVVADESAPIGAGLPGLAEVLAGDINALVSLGGLINLASVTAAVDSVQAAVDAAHAIKNASPTDIASIVGQVGLAQAATQSAFTAAESVTATATPITPGGAPADMATGLTAQASAFGQLEQLSRLQGTLNRVSVNLRNARN